MEGNLQTTSKELVSISSRVKRAGFNSCASRLEKLDKIKGKVLGPVSAPIFKIKRKYRIRLLIRGPKSLKLQNSLAAAIYNYKIPSGIKLSVDVDPISFN